MDDLESFFSDVKQAEADATEATVAPMPVAVSSTIVAKPRGVTAIRPCASPSAASKPAETTARNARTRLESGSAGLCSGEYTGLPAKMNGRLLRTHIITFKAQPNIETKNTKCHEPRKP